jgi:hypothetical protein
MIKELQSVLKGYRISCSSDKRCRMTRTVLMKQVVMGISDDRSKRSGKYRRMHFGKELLGYIAITECRRNS